MIVLDTHALIWWVSGDKSLSKPAKNTIQRTLKRKEEVIVSSISSWEIAMLISKGRVVLNTELMRWLDQVSCIAGVRFVSVNNEIAVKSVNLPGSFHKDPADRMIVATAQHLSSPVVTADKKIIEYEHVGTIW